MEIAATKRIDAGIKRGPKLKPAKLPHLKLKPSDVENEQRREARVARHAGTGRLVSLYTPEQRQQAVTDALDSLESGITVADVAKIHGISPSTLHSWLIADNRASEARTLYYARQIAVALERLDSADTPLELARGRELHRAWITTAAVRDHANYGPKQEIQHTGTVTIANALQGISERRLQANRIIDLPADSVTHSTDAAQQLDKPIPSTE